MKMLQIFTQLGETKLDFPDFIILLGVVLGFLLSITGIFRELVKEKYKSLLYLSMSLILLEIFLNRTGYMYYIVDILDFSEPFQFLLPPAIYLSITATGHEKVVKNWGFHLIPFFIYLILLIPVYFAPVEYKIESYFYMHHETDHEFSINNSFLLFVNNIRVLQMPLFFIQSAIYLLVSIQTLLNFHKRKSISKEEYYWWLLFSVLFIVLISIVLLVKSFFLRDIGDHLIAWFLTGILFLTTFRELIKSEYSQLVEVDGSKEENKERTMSFTIDDQRASEIKEKLISAMEDKKIFMDKLISINKVAKLINEPSYVISFILNDKIGYSFFEWISYYRIEEAKRLLSNPSKKIFTIEQIAEDVGYNSKSAFNKAFKKYTGQTPSEYKNQLTE